MGVVGEGFGERAVSGLRVGVGTLGDGLPVDVVVAADEHHPGVVRPEVGMAGQQRLCPGKPCPGFLELVGVGAVLDEVTGDDQQVRGVTASLQCREVVEVVVAAGTVTAALASLAPTPPAALLSTGW